MLGWALALGLVTLVANVIGSWLAVSGTRSGGKRALGFLGFAGGFMLAASLLEMIPESLEGAPWWMPFLVGAGFLLIYVIEQVFAGHAHEPPGAHGRPQPAPADPPMEHTLVAELLHPQAIPISAHAGLAAMIGFNVHDFIDGLAIGAGFAASASLGLLVFLAVVLHEVPAGAAISTIALASGRRRKTAVLAGASIGLATMVAIPLPFLLKGSYPLATASFLALSAGSFLYIAAVDLIPATGVRESRIGFLYVLLGVLVFLVTSLLAQQ
ncbi:MAG: ZIP family metal transporter [Chloroflexi bacterium]|nr:ZIP family metal transporter [Chloroflexota bacterium]